MNIATIYKVQTSARNECGYNLSSNYLIGIGDDNNEITLFASQFEAGETISDEDIQLLHYIEDPASKPWSLYGKKSALYTTDTLLEILAVNWGVSFDLTHRSSDDLTHTLILEVSPVGETLYIQQRPGHNYEEVSWDMFRETYKNIRWKIDYISPCDNWVEREY